MHSWEAEIAAESDHMLQLQLDMHTSRGMTAKLKKHLHSWQAELQQTSGLGRMRSASLNEHIRHVQGKLEAPARLHAWALQSQACGIANIMNIAMFPVATVTASQT